jgi:hypothetical protein
MPSSKPEPIRVAAHGIESKPITMNEPAPALNWRDLAALPPFQEFVCLNAPCPKNEDVSRWALIQAHELINATSAEDVFASYSEWHEAQGRWPAETPMGGLK